MVVIVDLVWVYVVCGFIVFDVDFEVLLVYGDLGYNVFF